MPKRVRAHQLEDLSRNRLHAAFESVGWTVEDLSKDYGEDLLIRLFDKEVATPYSFFVQAKATDNIERYKNLQTGRIRFQVKSGHVRHWIRFQEPVFLTMYDSKSDNTHWVCIQSALGEQLDQQMFAKHVLTVEIPMSNLLDGDGLLRLRGITRLRFDRIKRERQGAQVLIDLLAKRAKIVVNNYDPLNELIEFRDEGGRGELVFLGSFAEEVERCLSKAELSFSGMLAQANLTLLAEPWTSASRATSRMELDEIGKDIERDAGRLPITD